jgi:hypothetical protein
MSCKIRPLFPTCFDRVPQDAPFRLPNIAKANAGEVMNHVSISVDSNTDGDIAWKLGRSAAHFGFDMVSIVYHDPAPPTLIASSSYCADIHSLEICPMLYVTYRRFPFASALYN